MRKLALTILCLALLTACSAPVVDHRYIERTIPAPPAEPDYYALSWTQQGGWYCLDTEGARALMKDVELLRGNEQEMRRTLEGLAGQ